MCPGRPMDSSSSSRTAGPPAAADVRADGTTADGRGGQEHQPGHQPLRPRCAACGVDGARAGAGRGSAGRGGGEAAHLHGQGQGLPHGRLQDGRHDHTLCRPCPGPARSRWCARGQRAAVDGHQERVRRPDAHAGQAADQGEERPPAGSRRRHLRRRGHPAGQDQGGLRGRGDGARHARSQQGPAGRESASVATARRHCRAGRIRPRGPERRRSRSVASSATEPTRPVPPM